MKLVKRMGFNVFRFKCNYCGQKLEATGEDFKFVSLGMLGYNCPVCKQPRSIDEHLITRIEKEECENC